MKKMIIIAIFMAIGNLYAQNIIDPPCVSSSFTDGSVFDRSYGDTHFIKGWNYGGAGVELDNALGMNYYLKPYFNEPWETSDFLHSADSFAVAHRQFLHIANLTNPIKVERPFNAQSLRLEPTIEVCSTNAFVPRPYDSSGAVFGFYHKNKVRIVEESDHSDPLYHHAILCKDSVAGSVTVLDSIWDGSKLRLLNFKPELIETNRGFNGLDWYLTINLKNLDEDLDDFLNTTILTLKVKYTIDENTSGYIKFEEIPSTSLDDLADVDTLYNQDRGRFKELVSAGTPKPTEFNITGSMIRVDANNFVDSSITLSAYFICDGDDPIRYNPYLLAEGTAVNDSITHLNVEVIYHGQVDLAIRYIRIETPQAQEAFRGNFDHLVRDEIFEANELFDKYDGNASEVRIHRIYGLDEVGPNYWDILRYYNMLCDTLVNIETFTWQKAGIYAGLHINLPLQYLHATAFKEFFCGSTIDLNSWQSVPYVNYGKRTNDYEISYPEFFNLKAGRRGYYQNDTLHTFSDSLNSNYETWLSGDSTRTIPYDSMEVYDHFSHVSNSFQGTQNRIEFQLYQSYYKYQPLLYNSKPWIPFLWITPYGIIDPEIDSFTFHQYNCSATGELTRLKMYSPLILGCKGLCYWFKVERPHLDFSGDGRYIGLLSNVHDIPEITQNFTLDSLIYYDGIGGDYIKLQDDPNDIDDVFDDSEYRFETLGIDANHVYIGLKSARSEINKVHKWIDAVEGDLLNLRLQAWYGKGFVRLYSQHPDHNAIADTIIKQFIDYDDIRTKRIWNAEEGIYQSTYEDFDSSFFDVTLLKHIDDNDMDSVFFIGALNRRTDPLIYDQINETLKFFSTAEYDSLVVSADSNMWKSRWYKRLGCRTIKIPFNYRYSANADEFTVLKITELGADNENLTLKYFRDPDLNHLVDTTISADGSLVVNMLPGQGKIFKVEVSYSPKFTGYLNHSNQRNMVIYPTDNESLTWKDEIDEIRYHSVYFKQIPASNPERFGIYYRRSEIMDGTFPDEAIDWEAAEHLLSGTLDFDCVEDGLTTTDNNCKYPAIVVRYDSVAQVSKVYAVYVCSCFDDCKECEDTTSAYVVENIFNANNTTISVGTAKVIAKVNTFNYDQIDKWGTPMVNASRNGNYYCWSDSLEGIKAGFKGADQICFDNNSNHVISVVADSLLASELPYAMMPSLNSYSRIRMYSDTTCGEDDCAMVWMESPPDYPNLDSSEIYYTRLKLDDNGDLINYLPKTLCNGCYLDAEFNYDSTCICLSSYPGRRQSSNNGAPVIYRGIEVLDIPTIEETNPTLSNHHDMVYWQGTDDILNGDCIF
jgi:hypothetical protein